MALGVLNLSVFSVFSSPAYFLGLFGILFLREYWAPLYFRMCWLVLTVNLEQDKLGNIIKVFSRSGEKAPFYFVFVWYSDMSNCKYLQRRRIFYSFVLMLVLCVVLKCVKYLFVMVTIMHTFTKFQSDKVLEFFSLIFHVLNLFLQCPYTWPACHWLAKITFTYRNKRNI